jgi:hypothetical protein
MEEIANYAELIKLGLPDFIEVKGVTFCGDSDARFVLSLILWVFFSLFFLTLVFAVLVFVTHRLVI